MVLFLSSRFLLRLFLILYPFLVRRIVGQLVALVFVNSKPALFTLVGELDEFLTLSYEFANAFRGL